jgi:hypothetical protein
MEHYSLSLKRALPWKKKRAAVGVTFSNIRALGALTSEIIWLMCRCYRITRLSRRRRNSLRKKKNFLNMRKNKQRFSLLR